MPVIGPFIDPVTVLAAVARPVRLLPAMLAHAPDVSFDTGLNDGVM